jgi:hypothetical protein
MQSRGAIRAVFLLSGLVLSVAIMQADLAIAAQKKPGNLAAVCRKKAAKIAPEQYPQQIRQRAALFRQCMQNGGKL